MKQNRASAHQEARLIVQSGASADNIANTFDGKALCSIDILFSMKSRLRCRYQQQRVLGSFCAMSSTATVANGWLRMPCVLMVFVLIAANWICVANANNELINGLNGAADISTSTEFGKCAYSLNELNMRKKKQ